MSRYNTYTLPLGPVDNTNDSGDPDYRKVISSTVAGITSSNLSNVLLYSLYIPANTYTTNEVLDITTLGTKTNTNATCTLRFYIGATASLTATGPYAAATQLALCNYASNALSLPLHRRLGIRSTTAGTIVFRTSVSTTSDILFFTYEGSNPGGIEVLALDWTQDRYLIVSGDTNSASDILQIRWLMI